jgi:outer membrane protein assembly factor BamB
MTQRRLAAASRRGLLLGSAGLLGGCDWISDKFDSVFGEKKTPLAGEREPVMSLDRKLAADPKDNTPVRLPPAVANADWPQALGGIAHAPGHPALGQGLRQIWQRDIGTAASYRRRLIAPPLVAGNLVLAMDAVGEVTAFDATSGATRWSFDSRKAKERGGEFGGGFAVDGGTVYVVTGLAEAMALDLGTGQQGWRVPLPAPARGSPTVAGGRMVLPLLDNRVVALAVADGTQQWEYRGQAATTMMLGLPSPAIQGDIVVAGLASGEVAALRAENGRLLWSEALATVRGGSIADIAAVTAMPVIDRNRVIAAGLGGVMIALDLRSGRRIWERDATIGETPWVVGDWVFVATEGNAVACLGFDNGRVRWLSTLPRFGNPEKKRDPIAWGPPMLAGGRVLIGGSTNELLEMDPTDGSRLSVTKLPGRLSLQPAIANGVLYVLTDDASLTAYQGS